MADGRRWGAALLAIALVGCSGGDDAPDVVSTTTVALGPDRGDGVLTIGARGLARAERAAVRLAGRDIGAVLGEPLVIAQEGSVDAALASAPVADTLTFVTDPADPAPAADLAFRTVAPDSLRQRAIAQVLVGDGVRSIAVLGGGDLGPLTDSGLQVVPARDPQEVAAAEPEAVVLADPRVVADQIGALVDAGYSPGDNRFYVVAERADPALGFAIGDRPGVLEGVRVVQPGAEVDEELRVELLEVDASLQDFTGAAEAYDAVVITALAAEAAGTDDPEHVAAQVVGITDGRGTCASFGECRRLLADGDDVAYVGIGGGYRLDDAGNPTRSVFAVLQFGADNLLDPNRSEYVVVTAG